MAQPQRHLIEDTSQAIGLGLFKCILGVEHIFEHFHFKEVCSSTIVVVNRRHTESDNVGLYMVWPTPTYAPTFKKK
jgi:hypothetical protein